MQPKKLRLRRQLKAVEPAPTSAPVCENCLGQGQVYVPALGRRRPCPACTSQPDTVIAAMQGVNSAIQGFSSAMQGNLAQMATSGPVSTLRHAMAADEERNRVASERRLAHVKSMCGYVEPGNHGPLRHYPNMHPAIRRMLEDGLEEAYDRVCGGRVGFHYTTAIIIQIDILYLFMNFDERRVFLYRRNDGFIMNKEYRGRTPYGMAGALMGCALESYLSDRRFSPATPG